MLSVLFCRMTLRAGSELHQPSVWTFLLEHFCGCFWVSPLVLRENENLRSPGAFGAFTCTIAEHRILELPGLKQTLKITTLQPVQPWAGTLFTKSGCSEPHPTWYWTLPGEGHPQLLRTASFKCLTTHTVKNFFLPSNLNLLPVWSHCLFSVTTCPCVKSCTLFLGSL